MLLANGLELPPKPDGERPELPRDLTSLSDDELMGLFGLLNRWVAYAGGQLALAAVDEKEAEAELDVRRARVLIAGKSERSVSAAKARADEAPEVVEARKSLNVVYAVRKLTETVYDALERDVFLVSRELTRRMGRMDKEIRYNKFTA